MHDLVDTSSRLLTHKIATSGVLTAQSNAMRPVTNNHQFLKSPTFGTPKPSKVSRWSFCEGQVYLNGRMIDWDNGGTAPTPEAKGLPLKIGYCEGLGISYFKGMMGDVRVYDRLLSARGYVDWNPILGMTFM